MFEVFKQNPEILLCNELNVYSHLLEIIEDPESFKKWETQHAEILSKVVDKYIYKKHILDLKESLEVLKDRINIFHKNSITDESDFKSLNECIDFFVNFKNQRKTKNKKEQYKTWSEWVKLLSDKYSVNLVESINVLYDLNISGEFQKNNIHEHLIDQYKELQIKINSLEQELIYTLSTLKTKYQEYQNSKQLKKQFGKYYKKWSQLSDSEKNERIISYLENYCEKNEISKDTIDSFLNKFKLKYSNLKWDSSSGTIIDMDIKFNGESFEIVSKPPKSQLVRFDEKGLNDLLLFCLVSDSVDIEEKVLAKFEIKKLNKKEKKLVEERLNEFKKLVNKYSKDVTDKK